METGNILYELRTKNGLSQDELAQKLFVTRQAVSRWENGETVPNTETLKLLSRFFDVSINTLLGSPQKLVCQCCGMPLEDSLMSREVDGDINEKYCKWCYNDGKFKYLDMNRLFSVGSASRTLVQCGQRVASMAISLLQKGQTLVVGAAGASATGFLPIPLSIFMALTTKKSTSATMRKLIIAIMNAPY